MSAKVLTLLAVLLQMNIFFTNPLFAAETSSACIQSSDTLSEEEYNEIHEQGD